MLAMAAAQSHPQQQMTLNEEGNEDLRLNENGNSNGAETSNDNLQLPQEPDPDTIKMFVGQVPRSWSEQECRELFEQYGPVHQLNVLRDKATQISKGCCFVTFYHRKDAIAAQSALHNIKVLPQMHHAVQMKPADSENRNDDVIVRGDQVLGTGLKTVLLKNIERKLFVGMLNKKLQEGEVRQLFSGFGNIEDCTVLRDADNKSKGCAFVTFTSRSHAQNAIKIMHHSQTMEGCSMPLVVKFADTQKEKEAKKVHQNVSTQPTNSNGALNTAYLQLLQSQGGSSGPGGSSGGGNQSQLPNLLSQLPQLAALSALLQPGNASNAQNVLSLLGNVLASLGRLTEAQQQMSNGNAANNNNAANLSSLLSSLAGYSGSNGVGQQNHHSQPTADCSVVQQQQQQQRLMELTQLFGGAPAAPTGCGSQLYIGNILDQASLLLDSRASLVKVNNDFLCPGLATSPKVSTAACNAGTPPNLLMGGGGAQGTAANGNLITLTGSGLAAAQQQAQHVQHQGPGIQALPDSLRQAYPAIQHYAAAFPQMGLGNQGAAGPSSLLGSAPGGQQSGVGKQTEGPEGANLFIYHLPQEFHDADLAQTFSPFGNVLSAKVFIDKQTNLSKCFGFVSYDNALSAQQAIQAMNGFQIGTKRLKVQLKRSKSDGKPYQHPSQMG